MSRLSIILCLSFFTLFSCNNGSELKDLVKQTKEIEINKLDTNGKVLQSRVINDKAEIKEILSIVSNAEAPSYKCGYNYELHCKVADKNYVSIELNSAEICAVASFVYNDELMFRYLNKEKIQTLENKLN